MLTPFPRFALLDVCFLLLRKGPQRFLASKSSFEISDAHSLNSGWLAFYVCAIDIIRYCACSVLSHEKLDRTRGKPNRTSKLLQESGPVPEYGEGTPGMLICLKHIRWVLRHYKYSPLHLSSLASHCLSNTVLLFWLGLLLDVIVGFPSLTRSLPIEPVLIPGPSIHSQLKTPSQAFEAKR